MDTYLASGRIDISKEMAQQILNYLNEIIKTSLDPHEKKLAEGFIKRFEWIANKK